MVTEEENAERLASRVADLILNAKKVVVFTGAGVSTESGIPDFRSPGGLWDRYDPEEFTYQRFVSSYESRRRHWEMLADSSLLTIEAKPNPTHYAIAELERLGKLDCVITQNVDNLHQRAGTSEENVLELHGSTQRVVCLNCGKCYPSAHIHNEIKKGVEVPECEACHGMLKPDAVLFGEALPQRVLSEAIRRSRSCDLCIVIGSTLIVYPAAAMPSYALEAGAKLVIVNITPTPLDRQAEVLFHGKAGNFMSKVVEKVRGRLIP